MSHASQTPLQTSAADARNVPLSVSARLGRLQFHRSGKFRILQFTDIQDGPKVSADTIRLIAATCDAARPDLVVFTGDQIAGYDPAFLATYRKRRWATAWDGVYATSRAVGKGVNSVIDTVAKSLTPNSDSDGVSAASDPSSPSSPAGNAQERNAGTAAPNRKKMTGDTVTSSTISQQRQQEEDPYALTREMVRKQAAQFLAPVIERGIPFAITYGNHDFQCGLETSDLDAIYREFPGCLNPETSGTSALRPRRIPASGLRNQVAYACEPGTFALPVSSADGDESVIGLVIADSGDYAQEGGYGKPSEKAVRWIGQIPNELKAKSIIFQHIPLPQFYRLLRPVPATTAYAIQGYRTYDKQCYVIDDSVAQPGGYLGEGVSCPDTDAGEFAAMQESGGYFALFAGHDHRNAYVGEVDGILLGATPTCGFGSYGPPAPRRAARLFEFDVRHPYSPRTQLLEFGDIVGKPSSRAVYTFAMSHLPKGPSDATNLLRKPGVLATAAAALAGVGAAFLGSLGGDGGSKKSGKGR
jgi:hypothetical protein